MKSSVDYVIIGAGLAGCVFAERLSQHSNVIVLEKRSHIGGNCYDYHDEIGVLVHKYGPHIFHTNLEPVWKYLSQFTPWYYYHHQVFSYVDGSLVRFPLDETQVTRRNFTLNDSDNAETYLIKSIGTEAYKKFFKNYTKKQWGIDPAELSYEVVARIPIRKKEDPRYFTDRFQALPKYGYTKMFENMLDKKNITLVLQADGKKFLKTHKVPQIIWTGRIDEYYDYEYGILPYRSLSFNNEMLNIESFQGLSQINYPNDYDFTRILEWKYLTGQKHHQTTITREYPQENGEPFYPINTKTNANLYEKYLERARQEKNVHFVGRLAEYHYYNMDALISRVLDYADHLQRQKTCSCCST